MNIEALYRADLSQLSNPPLAGEEIADLCLSARRGEQAAKQQLILGLMGVICAYAARRQSLSCDFMELVALGNSILVEKLDEALQRPNPAGYLLKTAWHEMLGYKRRQTSEITVPTTPGAGPYVIHHLSLLADGDGEYSLPEPTPAPSSTPPEEYAPLYDALAQLPQNAQLLLCRLYGLCGFGSETLSELCGGNSTTRAYQAAKANKLRYLKELRRTLAARQPAFVRQHTSSGLAKQKSAADAITIPECTLHKLQEAEKTLRQRGAKLSMNKLRLESGVHTRYASAYLRHVESGEVTGAGEIIMNAREG